MSTEVALVVVHVRVDDCPEVILTGLALNWIVGAGAAGCTVTVADAVTLPPLPVAFAV
jgi:hypothetical protein